MNILIYGYRIKGKEYLNSANNEQKYKYENIKTNTIIFEGECLNYLRWNGKGKEYNNNALLFEGEYLNGKKMEWKRI